MSSLVVDGVHFAYRDTPVLSDVSMRVDAGELVALVGPNGSGKSTLLRVVVGLLQPAAGAASVAALDLRNLSAVERARHVAFLPQRVRPLYDFLVRRVVELARHPHHPGWGARLDAADLEIVAEAMRTCDVEHLSRRSFDTLSGGERQRVLLAAALAQSSEALVLDEPTTALDPHHQVETFEHLRAAADAGSAVLVATHDLNLAGSFADRAVLLDRGHVDIDGPPAQVIESSRLERVFGPGLQVGGHSDGRPWVLPRRAGVAS